MSKTPRPIGPLYKEGKIIKSRVFYLLQLVCILAFVLYRYNVGDKGILVNALFGVLLSILISMLLLLWTLLEGVKWKS
jgi:hypothetical protein